jgi:hypothetical protein
VPCCRLDKPRATTTVALAFDTNTPAPKAQLAYAFLPMRSYGLRFMVQGDWVVPSAR